MEFLCWRRQKRKLKFCADVHCKYCSDCEFKNAVALMAGHIFIEFSDKRSGRTLEIFLEKSHETIGMKRIHFYHIHSLERPVCYLVALLCSTKTFPKTSLISFRDFRAIFVPRFIFSFFLHMKFNFEPKSVRKIVWPTTTTTATDCSDKIKMDAINLCLYGIVSNELLKSC